VPFTITLNNPEMSFSTQKKLSRATISKKLHVSHTKLFENGTQTAQTSAKAAVTLTLS